jgi:type III secretory pathway component EscV
MKKTLELIFGGVAIALIIFTVMGVIMDIVMGGTTLLTAYSYTRMAVGAVLVGIGFSLPSRVYESEKLSLGTKVFVHMGIGCTVMLITGAAEGWIPLDAGWPVILMVIAAEVAAAFIIWAIYYTRYKKLAAQMNAALKQRRPDQGGRA